MNVTDELKVKIQHIVDSVPISYYCGQRISLCLDPDIQASNYNFFTQAIQIALQQIIIALNNIDDTDNESIEEIIRSLVYHEVSHAMLSPAELFERDYVMRRVKRTLPIGIFHSLINIAEDERIEATMQNFFYGINFKRLVALMNAKFKIKNPIDEFYGIVRLGIGPEEDIAYFKKALNKYMYLNSTDFNSSAQEDFVERILILFSRILKRWPEDYNLNKLNNAISEDDLLSALSELLENGTSTTNSNKNIINITDKEVIKALDKLLGSGSSSPSKSNYNTTKCINNWIHNVQSNKVLTRLRRLIEELQKSCGNDRAAINGYSGRVCPALAGRDDYRFFINNSRNGSHRAGRKLKLNLFLDNSGSYSNNADATNNLLCALNTLRMEKLLDLSIVTIGDFTKMHDIDHFRGITANEGTAINDDLFDHYKQSLTPGAINKNIVLLDGCVQDYSSKPKSALSVFNSSDTLIITDYTNEKQFNKYAPKARMIVMGKHQNYSEKLIDYVIIELSRLFR